MKVAIFGNKRRIEVAEYTREVVDLLLDRGAEILLEPAFCRFLVEKGVDLSFKHTVIEGSDFEADLAISIGGDGTFIRTAAKIGRKDTPIMGINAGRLGFLADVPGNDIENCLTNVLEGRCRTEEHAWLRLFTEERDYTDFNYAMNEIAILKRDCSSMITIHAWANGTFINSYQADGLLIATATGSTAYSMSVGGPILVPQASNFIITPVAPHSLNVRPIIIPDNWEIDLRVESRNKQYLIALDGRNNVFNEQIPLKIKKANFTTKILRQQDHDFFNNLREKLMWGTGTRK